MKIMLTTNLEKQAYLSIEDAEKDIENFISENEN